MSSSSDEVLELLQAWNRGDQEALEKLIGLVDPELRRIAHAYLSREPPGHDLETTALINEAFIRLIEAPPIEWQSRNHFFAIAARRMRQILVEYASQNLGEKRGGRTERVPFMEVARLPTTDQKMDELLSLNEALERLSKVDKRKSEVVELRYFGGLTFEETAGVLDVAPGTVKREWRLARAWLKREMLEGPTVLSTNDQSTEIAEMDVSLTGDQEGKLAEAWSNRELIATLMSKNWVGLKVLVQLRLRPDIADTEVATVLEIEPSVAASLRLKLLELGALEKQDGIIALSARANTLLDNFENAIGGRLD